MSPPFPSLHPRDPTPVSNTSVPFTTAVDAAEKKLGTQTGHNVDPAKYRSQNEKFTDKLRGLFEKLTGKKVPSKVSN
jgi:hypothetical protein